MRRETRRVTAEHLDLDLVDVVAETRDDGQIPVDHTVEDGVQHRLGAAPEQVGLALEPAPHGAEIGRLAVTHGQHEVGPDEDVHLAELDLFDLVDVARRTQHDEQDVVVPLDLRALVGDDRVLDRELVQPELFGE